MPFAAAVHPRPTSTPGCCRTAVAAAFLVALGGCAEATDPGGKREVTLFARETTLWQGARTELVVSVKDGAGNVVPPAEVAWASSDPAVLAVEPSGTDVRRAVARAVGPGTASISATVEGVEGQASITVDFGGFVHITYSGPRNGEFVATGPLPPATAPMAVTHTQLYRTREMLVFFGHQVRPDGTRDWFQMQLPGFATRRTWDFPVNCRGGGDESCTDWVGLVFNAASDGTIEGQTQYNARQGSVQITEYTATRVRAEFSGTFCHLYSPAPYQTTCEPGPGHELLTISGTIDLPIRP
ncbi:MAG TPA: Ig-like domain-containing protein [Longimicrobium sp.]|nr:Ig-like domain-containing protein [Longimicrobium sp.]